MVRRGSTESREVVTRTLSMPWALVKRPDARRWRSRPRLILRSHSMKKQTQAKQGFSMTVVCNGRGRRADAQKQKEARGSCSIPSCRPRTSPLLSNVGARSIRIETATILDKTPWTPVERYAWYSAGCRFAIPNHTASSLWMPTPFTAGLPFHPRSGHGT